MHNLSSFLICTSNAMFPVYLKCYDKTSRIYAQIRQIRVQVTKQLTVRDPFPFIAGEILSPNIFVLLYISLRPPTVQRADIFGLQT